MVKEKLVQALRDGCILAVDWQDIEEMLGEAPWRLHSVNVCNNAEVFPPVSGDEYRLSELEIHDILREGVPQWMSEVHDPDAPIPLLGRIQTRYFSVAQPKSKGPWIGMLAANRFCFCQ